MDGLEVAGSTMRTLIVKAQTVVLCPRKLFQQAAEKGESRITPVSTGVSQARLGLLFSEVSGMISGAERLVLG